LNFLKHSLVFWGLNNGRFWYAITRNPQSFTRNNEFWQKHNLADAVMTRLYTYQGAFIGFHLGYFAAFAIGLLGYYLQIHLTAWFELTVMTIPLVVAYTGARLVPYNLWQAYNH